MQDKSNKVSIIIVTRGKEHYINFCLDSLRKQEFFPFEIIVVDNSTEHNFSQAISKDFPEAKIYSSPKNLFYCEALNKGIDMSRGEFILCLNDDVVLDGKFIEEAMRGFFIDAKIGMISGKILRSDGKTLDSTGLFLTPWRTARERGYGTEDRGQYEQQEYIFGVNGAVAFYRRKMLEDIKIGSDYFDNDYHIFYEDLDVAWRGQNLSWKAYYMPGAIAYHVRGGTVRQGCGIDKLCARRYLSSDLHADLIKNRYLTIIRNESCLSFILHLPFILVYDFLAWSYILFFKPTLIKKFIHPHSRLMI